MHNSIMHVWGTKQASARAFCKIPWVVHSPKLSMGTDYCSEESGLDVDDEIVK